MFIHEGIAYVEIGIRFFNLGDLAYFYRFQVFLHNDIPEHIRLAPCRKRLTGNSTDPCIVESPVRCMGRNNGAVCGGIFTHNDVSAPPCRHGQKR